MENNTDNSYKDFEHEMMDAGRLKNLLCGAVFLLYIFVSAGLFSTQDPKELLYFTLTVVSFAFVAQFFVAPYTNKIITEEVSALLKRDRNGNLSAEERTHAVKLLLACPKKIAKEVVIIFSIICLACIIALTLRFTISRETLAYICFTSLLGTYNSGANAFFYAEDLCSRKTYELIQKDINAQQLIEEKAIRCPIHTRILVFYVLPLFLIAVSQIIFCWMIHYDEVLSPKNLYRTVSLFTLNTLITVLMGLYIQKQIRESVDNVNMTLEKLTENIFSPLYLPTDLSNEVSHEIFILDGFIGHLQDLLTDTTNSRKQIIDSSEKLFSLSKDTAQTAISEASAVRECIATLENTKHQQTRLSNSITEIQDNARETQEETLQGSELLSAGISKMTEIVQANLDTVNGIKLLSKKIDKMWDVINTIDDIAERTRTIAFNAELDVFISNDSSEKIHIIANEIRRLASTITDATTDIKQKITAIQHSTDNLIITSESGIQKTREGSEFYSRLEENFSDLKISSDITTETIENTLNISLTQSKAFEQIDDTLLELNSGFELFSQSSQLLNTQVEKLQKLAKIIGEQNGTQEDEA